MSGKPGRRKTRVAFQKNRQRRARTIDVTKQVLDEGIDAADFRSSERLSGKGDLTRHRTVVAAEATGDGRFVRAVEAAGCVAGRVLSAVGLTVHVQLEDGRRAECAVRRVVRTMARDARNAVVAGDRVLVRLDDGRRGTGTRGVVERVEPRAGVLSRGSHYREHVLVANVDQVLIVVSAGDPPLKPSLVDRFLISAVKGSARPILCINKCDLADRGALQKVAALYSRCGCDVVLASARDGTGLTWLRTLLADRETVLAGQSGVGKSSLLNAVQPGLALRTAEVSDESRKGRHTTRTARLIPLAGGGWVVDTPGIRQLELWDVGPAEIEGYYVEFRPYVPFCRFPDCSHLHEEGCGVRTAVRAGLVSRLRYASYCRIVEGD